MKTKIMSKDGGSKIVDLNRRKAIREKCLNCVGWEVHRANACDDNGCHLHPFRTAAGKQNAQDRSRALREYCHWCTNRKVSLCVSPLCPLHAFTKFGMESGQKSVSLLENDDIEAVSGREAGLDDVTPVTTARIRRKPSQAENSSRQ